jgi:hypothetical protein
MSIRTMLKKSCNIIVVSISNLHTEQGVSYPPISIPAQTPLKTPMENELGLEEMVGGFRVPRVH